MLAAACGSGSAGTAGDTSARTTGHAGAHTSSPVAAAQPLRAGERFVDLTMPKPYTPAPPHGGTDEYRCLVIDPHLTTPAFLTGTQFEPQNLPIVHHAIVFAVAPEQRAAARARTPPHRARAGPASATTASKASSTSAWVDTWTPGATETLLQQDVGFQLQPGSLLVLQMHYNLLATDGRPARRTSPASGCD